MSDIWELYHQTGPDGQEWGVKIRPGYTVTGFAREDAEAVVAWQNTAVSQQLEAFTDAYRRELVRAGDIIEQLEAAFLKSESRRLWDRGESTGESNFDCPEAREALERIRSGKDE